MWEIFRDDVPTRGCMPRSSARRGRRGLVRQVLSLWLMRTFVTSLALLVVVQVTRAASPSDAPVPALTLAEALAEAHAQQAALKAAHAQAVASDVDARVANTAWSPVIVAEAQGLLGTSNNTTSSYVGVAGVDLARIGGTKAGAPLDVTPYPSTVLALSLQQQLLDFGRIHALTAPETLHAEADAAHARAVDLDVALDVEEAFDAVLAAHALVTVAEDAYARAQTHCNLARALVHSELRAPIELTRAETELARADVGRIRAQGMLNSAQSALAVAIGASSARVDASADVVTDAVSMEKPSTHEATLARALAADPVVLEAQRRVQEAQARTVAVDATALPSVVLSAALSMRDGGAPVGSAFTAPWGLVPRVPNADVAVVLRWPLLDAAVGVRHDAAVAREGVRRAELEAVQQRERAAVDDDVQAIALADATVVALERSLAAATQNRLQADARFRMGLGASFEVADADAAQTDAATQLALGHLDAARARARLHRLLAETP